MISSTDSTMLNHLCLETCFKHQTNKSNIFGVVPCWNSGFRMLFMLVCWWLPKPCSIVISSYNYSTSLEFELAFFKSLTIFSLSLLIIYVGLKLSN